MENVCVRTCALSTHTCCCLGLFRASPTSRRAGPSVPSATVSNGGQVARKACGRGHAGRAGGGHGRRRRRDDAWPADRRRVCCRRGAFVHSAWRRQCWCRGLPARQGQGQLEKRARVKRAVDDSQVRCFCSHVQHILTLSASARGTVQPCRVLPVPDADGVVPLGRKDKAQRSTKKHKEAQRSTWVWVSKDE